MQEVLSPTQFLTLGQMLWIVFDFLAICSVLITLIFYYHWGKYSPTHAGAIITIVVYTAGMCILLLGMFGILTTI